ncbi:MAG: hypothetical protein AVDCRST_MAG03-1117 [uncultured Rubrobacteraceae bacterium]|uniref:Uncharacterized protein n=1 Tax=uncultured Rubrobacteraceae bacterium TaxID=349277 RepID=A0A6J4P0S9_9ACTN|nr:MAG: hypothetical protein AVDCRST_MAG03-1117 [uncultured Rubrobacteraceae bacterium]
MRILVAFEPEYQAYQGVMVASVRILRPHAKVESATLDRLGDEVKRFDPHLVICSQPNTVDPGGKIAWVELSIHSTRPSKICVGGRYSESVNPALETLLAIVDEVEELMRTDSRQGECPPR